MREALTLLGIAVATAACDAQEFFTIDSENDVLVRVSAATGDVTVVGSLEADTTSAQRLHVYEGLLYALLREPGTNVTTLAVLDEATGAVVSSVLTDLDGENVPGESLSVIDGQLVMSFDPGGIDAQSERLGTIDPATGVVTEIADFTNALDPDLDGVEQLPDGRILNLDHDGGNSPNTDLYECFINDGIGTASLIKAYDPPLYATGLLYDDSGLWAVRFQDPALLRFDMDTGDVVEVILLETDRELRGLASASCVADCNDDGVLNILDFVCFQQTWVDQDPAGDCNDDGIYNILDFVCYQGLFQAGCD